MRWGSLKNQSISPAEISFDTSSNGQSKIQISNFLTIMFPAGVEFDQSGIVKDRMYELYFYLIKINSEQIFAF